MSFGDFTYTPLVNRTVIAECWAGGGQGRIGQFFDANNQWMGPGGGGGAYSRKFAIPLTALVGYAVRVGAPGQSPSNHESFFINLLTCYAVPGGNAAFQLNGLGGAAAAGAGDVKYSGGDGAPYTSPDNVARPGGGGGSSASRSGNGSPGSGQAGGTVAGGGDGGPGGHIGPGGAGGAGLGPGGGGGGGGTPQNGGDPGSTAGPAAEGAVVLWEDLGVWPPFGQIPLAAYGTPPANPVSRKATKSATFM